MDVLHRPTVHETYDHAANISRAADHNISLVKPRGMPFYILVVDLRLGPGQFYQCFTLFGLVYIHSFIVAEATPSGGAAGADWLIASHWIFWFLHPLLHRRMRSLHEKQHAEDIPIRNRRAELRERGFSFKTDAPDYASSNRLTWNVVPPKLDGVSRFSLHNLNGSDVALIDGDPFPLLVRKRTGGVQVWPGICPHEGAVLSPSCVSEDAVTCPLHLLRTQSVTLSAANPRTQLLGVVLELRDNEIVASTAAPVGC